MANFIHKWLNPHCEHCIAEKKEKRQAELDKFVAQQIPNEPAICDSCETLKMQLAIKNNECERLLSRILDKPIVEVETKPIQVTQPKGIPWAVRKQMLESEDRNKARAAREAAVPDHLIKESLTKDKLINETLGVDSNKSTEELENEIVNG